MLRLYEQDAKMWQTPTMAFTAQAFLLTIGLGSTMHTPLERAVAATLSLVIALLSIQLMAKHRYHSALDKRAAQEFEHDPALGLLPLVVREAHEDVPTTVLTRHSAYLVWQSGLALFGLVSLWITVQAVGILLGLW
ncbi:hypothetical protein [Serinicoccus sediminis]|uniref:hypothetical protein n=1 Tax=Serinicoccus sediminis TaxID=2306021 RepID=UPI00101F1210|nr:hypothetical protein [Serinicoccus sediminis]